MKSIFIIMMALILLATIPTSDAAYACSPTCYVAKTGNDGNAGTSGSPWLTINYAASQVTAGDTVYVKVGNYNEQVTFANSGTDGNYIHLTNYSGDIVTINGAGVNFTQPWGDDEGIITIWSKSYIKVTNMRIENSSYMGMYANGNGGANPSPSHINFSNNYINNISYAAIYINGQHSDLGYGTGVVISGNTVNNAHHTNPTVSGGEVISIVGGQSNFYIYNNLITNSYGGVFDFKDGVTNGYIYGNTCDNDDYTCFYVDAFNYNATNIYIYKNIIKNAPATAGTMHSNCFNVAAEQAGGVVNGVYFYNNLCYNNAGTGMRVASYSLGSVSNVVMTSNTLYNNGDGEASRGGVYLELNAATGIVVRNNIFSQNTAFQIRSDDADATITNNIIYGTQPYGAGNYALNSDPLFVSTSIPNFYLQTGSPAIDYGSSTAFVPSTDYAGTARPQGAAYDLGAYEYTGVVPTPTPQPTPGSGTTTTMRKSGFTLWGYDINFNLFNATNITNAIMTNLKVTSTAGKGNSSFACFDNNGVIFSKTTPCNQ